MLASVYHPDMAAMTKISRRLIVRLAAASLLVISGCTVFRQSRDLDQALEDLETLLNQFADDTDEQNRLKAAAERIGAVSRELATENADFLGQLDAMLNDRDATDAALTQTVDAHRERRASLRNDLLTQQDEIHAALTPDQWAEVVEVLNRSGPAMVRQSITVS